MTRIGPWRMELARSETRDALVLSVLLPWPYRFRRIVPHWSRLQADPHAVLSYHYAEALAQYAVIDS